MSESAHVPDTAFWSGRRVLVTGNTGFKGAWLWVWLRLLGAEVTGLALGPPSEPNLWSNLERAGHAHRIDVRDREAVAHVFESADPQVVFHLAAQPLVRESYADPVGTVATNIMGTAHVLDAARGTKSLQALVSVTSDKCYRNPGAGRPFLEGDPLGGRDPYSASKAAADLITEAWRHSFLAERGIRVATARAGNVVGGGDWGVDRLVPDCLRAFEAGHEVEVRHPRATRPWQHVMDPLAGYLILAERLCAPGPSGDNYAEAWNFGPDSNSSWRVERVVDEVRTQWGNGQPAWIQDPRQGPHESGVLELDSTKALHKLGWSPRLDVQEAIRLTVAWHKAYLAGEGAELLVRRQIEEFMRS